MTGVFVQVRFGSTRLPGKAFLTLSGRSSIEWVIAAMAKVRADLHAVVTDALTAPLLAGLCASRGVALFAGSADDVLERFVRASEHFGVTTIVRATGDNPLLSYEAAQESIEEHVRMNAEYTTFTGMPVGTGVEIIESAALRRACEQSRDSYEHEHVTPHIYRNPGAYRCHRTTSRFSSAFATPKVSLDTVADYRRLLTIFAELRPATSGTATPEPITYDEILGWFARNGETE